MKSFLLILTALFCFFVKTSAQNLVPNPSFEIYNDCFTGFIYNAQNWCQVNNGTNVALLTPCQTDPYLRTPRQYYSSCFQSYQTVRTGSAYASFGVYTQSPTQESGHPQVKLIDTLEAGKIYCVTYYVSMLNNARYSMDKLGGLLTPMSFPCFTLGFSTPTVAIAGQYTPQVVSTAGVALEDTLGWMEISGTFTAVGNEAYLTLGDFFLHSQHFIKNSYPTNCNGLAEYYIDDVSVEEVFPAVCASNATICKNDSVIIGNNSSEATTYNWQPSAGLSCTNCPNPKASPSVTTTYTLTKTQCKATTTASVTTTVNQNCTGLNTITEVVIPNVITPNGDGVNDSLKFSIGKGTTLQNFTLYNRWGNVIHVISGNNFTELIWDGRTTSGEMCSEGVYFYALDYTDTDGQSVHKKGYVTLFK